MFEFISTDIGSQGTVCGGGRYNNLVEEVGGKPTPAVGFGLGLERLLLVLENTNSLKAEEESVDYYFAPLGDNAKSLCQSLAYTLRVKGISAETDIMDRSVKAQMKYADKIGAKYVVVIGDDEIANGVVNVKNMSDGSTEQRAIESFKTL